MNDFLFERPAWHKRAACRGMDPKIFFVQRGESLDEAKKICKPCPVKRQCNMQAICFDDEYGVWGGEGRVIREKKVNALVAIGKIDRSFVGSRDMSLLSN